MKFTLFVTCGRGLDDFVKEEIYEKIPEVTDIHSLGEGKIVFSLQTWPPQITGKASECHTQDHGKPTGSESYETNLKGEKLPCIEALLSVYKLKLVERIFLLLHYEEIGSNSVDETKIRTILENTDLDAVADVVSALKSYQKQHTEDQVLCCKPDSCPGLVNRRADKEQTRQKRIDRLSSRNESSDWKRSEKHLKRKTDFDLSESEVSVKSKRGEIEDINVEKEKYSGNDSQHKKGHRKSVFDLRRLSSDDKSLNSASADCELPKTEVGRKSPEIDLHDHTTTSMEEIDAHLNLTLVNHEVTRPDLERKLLESTSTSSKCANVRNTSDHTEANIPSHLSDTSNTLKEQIHKNILPLDFRVSCRIRGRHKAVLTSEWLTKEFVRILGDIKSDWVIDWTSPVLDFYVNVTDLHFILGASLSPESLSLRHYISHITLRSTTSYLMAKLCFLMPGDFLLDPMCGGGTILAEAAKCFDVGQVIGSDVSKEQLEVARCNLHSLGVPFSLLLSEATRMPLNSSSINAIACDFPFGQKHKLTKDNEALLLEVIGECCRLLVPGGRAVFLLSSKQHDLLKQLASNELKSLTKYDNAQLNLKSAYPVSLGRTIAYVVVLLKG